MSNEFEKLIQIAKFQKGYVAAYQTDVSAQTIQHHVDSGRVERVLRGIYWLPQYLHEEDEEFVIAYLWSREDGVLSHETALAIHDLSDVLPAKVHMTLPPGSRVRREVPEWLELHFADVPDEERQMYDIVPVTSPARTLVDVASSGLEPELLRQAVSDAKRLKLVSEDFEWELIRRLGTE